MDDKDKLIQDLKDDLAKIADAFSRFGDSVSDVSKGVKKYSTETQHSTKSLAEFRESMHESINNIASGSKIYKTTFDRFGDHGKKVALTFDNLRKSVESSTTQSERYDLEQALAQSRRDYIQHESWMFLSNSVKLAASASMEFAKTLQSATPGVSTGSSVLGTAIGAAGSAGSALGGIIGNVGAAMSTIPGPAMAVGIALGIAGGALSSGSKEIAEKLKLANEIFSVEFKKTETAFYSLNSSGAIFANGMTGMRNAANQAGLTLDIFSNIVKNNSEVITKSGLGVSDGAVKIGRILNREGGQLRDNLLNLGFSIEEQAEITAMTMRDMRATGGILRANDQEISSQTKRYAENLRLISAITGEDAKAKIEQARQMSSNIAFQAKLENMDAKQRAEINSAMAAMTEIQKKNFMDTVLFGSVINREGAAAAAMAPALASSVQAFAEQFKSGVLSTDSVAKLNAEFGDTMRSQILNLSELGLAAAAGVSGLGATLGEALSKELQAVIKLTPESVDAARKSIEGAMSETDILTNKFKGVVENTLNSSVKLEQLFLESGALDTYAKVVDKTTEGLSTFVSSLVGANSALQQFLSSNGTSVSSEIIRQQEDLKQKELANLATERESLQSKYDELGFFSKMFGNLTDEERSVKNKYDIIREYETALKSLTDVSNDAGASQIRYEEAKSAYSKLGSANGNVLSGPDSGYKALLHGVEAVVPLPDGRNIPVDLGGNVASGLSEKDQELIKNIARIEDMESLRESMDNQSRQLREMTALFSRAVEVLGENRDLSREMLNVMY